MCRRCRVNRFGLILLRQSIEQQQHTIDLLLLKDKKIERGIKFVKIKMSSFEIK